MIVITNTRIKWGKNSYLNKREMDYHWDSTTENSVCPKLGTVTHAVMTAISSNDNTGLEGLQFGKHLALVFLPIEINQWKKLDLNKKSTVWSAKNRLYIVCIAMLVAGPYWKHHVFLKKTLNCRWWKVCLCLWTYPLILKEGLEWDTAKTHEGEQLKNLGCWSSSKENRQCQEEVTCRYFQTWHLGLAVPEILLITLWIVAMCSNDCLCPILTSLYCRIICLADVAKLEEKQQLSEEDDMFWFCSDVGVLERQPLTDT